MKLRTLFIAIIGALMLVTAPAHAAITPQDGDETAGPEIPAEVAQAFEGSAPTLVSARGIEAFPEASAEEISSYTIGTPIRVAEMATNASVPEAALLDVSRWAAPISDDEGPVGAVSLIAGASNLDDAMVVGDTRLGTELAAEQVGQIVIFDPEFSAWFVLRDQAIEPADVSGANVVLGTVPFEDFLHQRIRLLDRQAIPTSSADPVVDPAEDSGISIIQVLIIVLGLIAIVTTSLIWLRWDQNRDEEFFEEEEEEDLTVNRKGVVGSHESKPRFKDSAGTVSVYQRPKSSKIEPDPDGDVA